jgi:hypothetical protein
LTTAATTLGLLGKAAPVARVLGPAGAALSMFKTGLDVGQAGNAAWRKSGGLGTNADGTNRNLSDASADAGSWVRRKMGGGTGGAIAGGVSPA